MLTNEVPCVPMGFIRTRKLAHYGAIWTGLCSEFFVKLGDAAKKRSRAEHGVYCWKSFDANHSLT